MGNAPSTTVPNSTVNLSVEKSDSLPLGSKSEPLVPSKPNDRFHRSTNDNDDSKSSKVSGLASFCPVITKKSPQIEYEVKKNDQPSACPVKSPTYKNPEVYNVYSQKIDPTNNMPAQANQTRADSQTIDLSTNRVPSSIPKAGTDKDTWLYPSPQMFWNALVRKNKTDDASEEYMDTVVAIHNNMNENTWQQVLAWEELHTEEVRGIEGGEPKLLRFLGRPDELSPKARLRMFLGQPAPFDRHDWYVDRAGKIVRYVIDYYHVEEAVELDRKPQHLKDSKSLQSIKVDVRPALDSLESIFDRMIKMPLLKYRGRTIYDPPSFFPQSKPSLPAISEEEKYVKDTMSEVTSKCVDYKAALSNCKSDIECMGASMKLQRCAASVICPDVVKQFDLAVMKTDAADNKIDEAFSHITSCLDDFQVKTTKIKRQSTSN